MQKANRESIDMLHVTGYRFDGYPKRSEYSGETIKSHKSVIDDIEKWWTNKYENEKTVRSN